MKIKKTKEVLTEHYEDLVFQVIMIDDYLDFIKHNKDYDPELPKYEKIHKNTEKKRLLINKERDLVLDLLNVIEEKERNEQ